VFRRSLPPEERQSITQLASAMQALFYKALRIQSGSPTMARTPQTGHILWSPAVQGLKFGPFTQGSFFDLR
jgi:hypothetical protein